MQFVTIRLPDEAPTAQPTAIQPSGDWPATWAHEETDFYFFDSPSTDEFDTEIYNPEFHKDKDLQCPGHGCCARLQCVEKNPDTGQAMHWKAHDNLDHKEDCQYKNRGYDKEKGYLVRVNIRKFADPVGIETNFNEMAAKYSHYHQQHPSLRDSFEHLKKMENFRLGNAADLLALYNKDSLERMAKNVFDVDGRLYSEEDFLIRRPLPGEFNRYKGLYDRLREIPSGNHLPCIMQFHLPLHKHVETAEEIRSCASQAVFLYRDMGDTGDDGEIHFMRPRVVATSRTPFLLREAFRQQGDFLVAGYVTEGDVIKRDATVIHYADMKIYDSAQILNVEMNHFLPPVEKDLPRQPRLDFGLAFSGPYA